VGGRAGDGVVVVRRRELEHDFEIAVDVHVGQRHAAVALRDALEEQIDAGVRDA
jgi:hypothetical protein